MKNQENKPFCYILHFPRRNLRYLGLRVGKDLNPDNLIVKYKTSSPKVKKLIQEGEEVVVEDVIYFESIDAAAQYEHELALKIKNDDDWINQQAVKYSYYGKGKYYAPYRRP